MAGALVPPLGGVELLHCSTPFCADSTCHFLKTCSFSLFLFLVRSLWAKQRIELLQSSNVSTTTVAAIESSLFGITLLDEQSAQEAGIVPGEKGYGNAQAKATLCSANCKHTWFDHGYNVFALPDGSVGLQGNHSPADAMTALFTIRWLQEALRAGTVASPQQVMAATRRTMHGGSGVAAAAATAVEDVGVTPLPFDLYAWPAAHSAVDAAAKHAQILYDSVDVRVVASSVGSDAIRKAKLPPDTLVQMALQLTFYRLHGRVAVTYETAHTRQFYHGRTETIRSCSVESKALCELLGSRSGGGGGNKHRAMTATDAVEAGVALNAAVDAHNTYAAACMSGQGCDRHLLVLRLLAAQVQRIQQDGNGSSGGGGGSMATPSIFLDGGFSRGTTFDLSTSNIGGMGWKAPSNEWWGGYAPATMDGYGCGYTISPRCVKILLTTCVGSSASDPTAFEAAFHVAIAELVEVQHRYAAAVASNSASKL